MKILNYQDGDENGLKDVSIEIKGLCKEKESPFAAETPILKPVYEPGPLLTAIASISLRLIDVSFKTSEIKGCKTSA